MKWCTEWVSFMEKLCFINVTLFYQYKHWYNTKISFIIYPKWSSSVTLIPVLFPWALINCRCNVQSISATQEKRVWGKRLLFWLAEIILHPVLIYNHLLFVSIVPCIKVILWLVHTQFLKIVSVQTSVCACVSAPEAINN